MAIARTLRPDITLFVPNPQLADPFPLGIWKAGVVITGDASGGKIVVTVAPPSAAAAALYLWSWETGSLMVSPNGAAREVCFVLVTGERYFDDTGAIVSLLFNQQGYIRVDPSRTGNQLVWDTCRFIHQPSNALTNSYAIDADNGNGVLFTYGFWGYIWHPEARRLAGGPRRPT